MVNVLTERIVKKYLRMESKEIIDRIESLISSKINEADEIKKESENDSYKSIISDIKYLALQFFVNILKAPFKILTKYLWLKIIVSIKNDAKLYALIIGIMIVLFVFFSVLWLFVSIAVGVYFLEHGHSMLISVIYSIVFQIISFISIGLIAYIASQKIKSLSMLKKLIGYIKTEK